MFKQHHFETWSELEGYVHSLCAAAARHRSDEDGYYSDLLFRGQSSNEWSLESTLLRTVPRMTSLAKYYRLAAVAKTQIESFTPRTWPDIDHVSIERDLCSYDYLRRSPLPHYEYLVYLRHHGFPSPLLDWSHSLYVAAFFAFSEPKAERVALFAYQEFAGHGKASSSDKEQIHTLGTNIRTHQRHFLQQAEYTAALRYEDGSWRLASHMDVLSEGRENQDHLWKLTVPADEARSVIKQLEHYNINAFSLFQSEDALLATLTSRLLTHGPYGAA
jgi:FRG domain